VKRILLVNFHESPENFHFERAFLRALAVRGGLFADIVHDFENDYSFIGAGLPPGARRFKCEGLAWLKNTIRRPYELVVMLDFPKRSRSSSGFFWLLREAPAAKKIFIANHLIPMPGQSLTADLVRRIRALDRVDTGYMLESDDASLWGETGLSGRRLLKRGYASDCVFYKPSRARRRNYIFSAGSAGRNFGALAAGAGLAGLGLTVFSDSPGGLPAWVDFRPLSQNIQNLRAAASGAAAVVVPVSDGYLNEAAGNSIAFLGMALGRPVLARRTRYMERFIRDGVNGFFYDRLTPGAITAGLKRITAYSPERLRKLGANARRTVLARANLDKFCAAFLLRHS